MVLLSDRYSLLFFVERHRHGNLVVAALLCGRSFHCFVFEFIAYGVLTFAYMRLASANLIPNGAGCAKMWNPPSPTVPCHAANATYPRYVWGICP